MLKIWLAALAALQLILGIAVQIAVLLLLGAGPDTDAFVAAQAVPLVLVAVLTTTLQSVWLPRLSVLTTSESQWSTELGVAFGQSVLLGGGLSMLLLLAVPAWLPLLFPGFDGPQLGLTGRLVEVLLLAAALSCGSSVFLVALRAQGRFLAGESVAAAAGALALLTTLRYVPEFGVEAAAWASLGRALLITAVLWRMAGASRLRVLQSTKRRRLWQDTGALLAGTSIYKTGPLIDRYWLSQAAPGGMTLYVLALAAVSSTATIIERVASMPVGPDLARLAKSGDLMGLRTRYRSTVIGIIVISLLVAGLLLLARAPVVWLLQGWLGIEPVAAERTWLIGALLMGYFVVAACGAVPVAAFQALGDFKTTVRTGTAGFVLGAGLKALGYLYWGLLGLAAATSLYYLANFLMNCALLERLISKRLCVSV